MTIKTKKIISLDRIGDCDTSCASCSGCNNGSSLKADPARTMANQDVIAKSRAFRQHCETMLASVRTISPKS